MKRPNLMVGNIIRKKYRQKHERKPPTSTSVRYFNSLQNRSVKLSISETELYEKWTIAIRENMEKKHVWPTGTEEWTQELVSEYIRQLQIQLWKNVKVPKKFLNNNKHYVLIQMVDYPNRRFPDGRHLLRVFRAIYKNKIRRYVRRQKICDLNHWRWFATPLYTASYTLELRPKNIIKIEPGDLP